MSSYNLHKPGVISYSPRLTIAFLALQLAVWQRLDSRRAANHVEPPTNIKLPGGHQDGLQAMADQAFLAVDLGASSGRLVAGLFDGASMRLQELHRFPNGPTAAADRLYWDVLGLWSQVCDGLRAAPAALGVKPISVGVDTWGVDFALLDRNDEVLGSPYCYRDHRTDGMLAKAFELSPREEIFRQTGVQFMQINSLYQLLAMRLSNSPLLEAARSLLMMPDLFHWLLTGVKLNEFTDATTSQFYDPTARAWAKPVLESLGIPTAMFGEIAQPGVCLGKLRPSLANDLGLPDLKVVLPGTHDTASAVLATPTTAASVSAQPNWCYISSGTWSLMGVETPRPIINDRSLALNFTNEGGVDGTFRVLKNIGGLWLVQECRRIWNRSGKNYRWEDLTRLAADAPSLRHLVNPDDPSLLAPDDMPRAIAELCRRTGQDIPANEGAVVRAAIEGLALRYRQVLAWLEELCGSRLETIHVVGGGSQDRLLCQVTADACNRTVVAGPVEATALGNLLMQAIAHGSVGSVGQAREIVRASSVVETYYPRETAAWDEAYERFVRMSD